MVKHLGKVSTRAFGVRAPTSSLWGDLSTRDASRLLLGPRRLALHAVDHATLRNDTAVCRLILSADPAPVGSKNTSNVKLEVGSVWCVGKRKNCSRPSFVVSPHFHQNMTRISQRTKIKDALYIKKRKGS